MKLFVFIISLLASSLAFAETLSGKVIGVMDGDTIKILTIDKKQHKIRLAEIDTPEKKQPYGQKAKQALSDMIYRKNVNVKVSTTDRYGRKIGQIYLGDKWINGELVKEGHAWVYRRYARENKQRLLMLENNARKARKGLWALSEAERIEPWLWRKANR